MFPVPPILALAALLSVSAGRSSLPPPTNLVAEVDCGYFSASWDPVPGASGYAVEIAAAYDSTSPNCAGAPDTTVVYSFTSRTPTILVDFNAFLADFAGEPRSPCRLESGCVRALGPGNESACVKEAARVCAP